MDKFEVGKVYACDNANFCINDYYEFLADTNVTVEVRYENTFIDSGYTLLKCIQIGEETLFEEYYTKTLVVSYAPLYSKTYVFTNETLFDSKKALLNRKLLYIDKENVLEIDDNVLDKLSYTINGNLIKSYIDKKISKSRANLYEAYNKSYQHLIADNYRLAETENVIREFEAKSKVHKKEYFC